MGNYALVGTRVVRQDAIAKVTGDIRYVSDMKFPGTLQGKILHSPHPHARILLIDTSRAKSLVGVRAVVTAEDTPKAKFSTFPAGTGKGTAFGTDADRLILAYGKVRCVADPVAAVAAIDEDTAEEALELIRAEYEPLPAIFDPDEAMLPEAPQIHDHAPSNIIKHVHRHFGNIERGFAEADEIFEDSFATQAQAHATLEPHICLAEAGRDGKVTVWAAANCISFMQPSIAATLGIPSRNVKMATSYLGGNFGGKNMDPIAGICPLLAIRSGRPVRMTYTRTEEMAISGHRHPITITLRTGVKRDGKIVARQVRSIIDAGAYNKGATNATSSTGYKSAQLYLPPNYLFDGYAVYTNNPTGNAYRGWGGPQIHFAMEVQMDIMAEKLELDPLEIRFKNANQPGQLGACGAKMSSAALSECLQKTGEALNWKTDAGKGIGRGVASMIHAGGSTRHSQDSMNYSEAYLQVDPEGLVNVLIGEPEIGTGGHTVMSMIVAEELGVDLEDVRINHGTTDDPLSSFLIGASRVTFVTGNAVKNAAVVAKQQLLETAAELLEANIEDLEMRNRTVYVKGTPDRGLPIGTVVAETSKRTKLPVAVRGAWTDTVATGMDATGYGSYSSTYSFGAQGAEVEVDKETGQVRILKFVDAQDCGFAINPLGAEGQMHGGVAMGIGYGLTEELVRGDGKILNPDFAGYKILTALDMPPVKTILVEPVEQYGPFGAKALGEPAMVPTAPALANAIYGATGVRLKRLPMTPEAILVAMKEMQDN